MLSDNWTVEVLRCPSCLSNLRLQVDKLVQNSILSGYFQCLGCGTQYAIRDGMGFFGMRQSERDMRLQEMNAEFEWNFEMHGFQDHQAFGERSFRIAQDVIRVMKQELPFGRVLDAGAGGGCHSWQLSRHGYEVLAAELTPEMLAVGDSYYADGVYFERILSDCTVLPIANNTFDAVFCKELAHHVKELGALFGEFNRVLKPRGLLILVEPIKSGRPGLNTLGDPAKQAGLTHQDYTLAHYSKALRQNGFGVSRARHSRRPINKRYRVLHSVDLLSTRLFALNQWGALSAALLFRSWLVGGEIAIIARRETLSRTCAGSREIECLPANRLELAAASIAAMRSQQASLLPLLRKVYSEQSSAALIDP